MPDPGNALLAQSLLLGQRRRPDPLANRLKYGEALMQQGASTAPLGSGNPLEGLARALTAGLGGYFAGQAEREYDDRETNTNKILADILTAKTPEEVQAIASRKGGNTDVLAPIIGQLVLQKQQQMQNGVRADQFGAAVGTAPQGAPAASSGVPQPGYSASTAPGGVTSNNVGNITNGQGGFRQYDTPQAGTVDLVSLLRSYPVNYNNGQPMTLMQIGSRYAPADDGKDPMLKGNDPAVWVRNVGQIAGIDPNQPLDFDNPAILTKVVNGINAQEKGAARQPGAVLQQGVAQAMDPTAFASPGSPGPIAQPPQIAQGDTVPTGAPPSATSGPPDVPRPQPTADQIAKYKALIASGQLTGAQAVSELDKEVTQEWQVRRQQALETWKDQQQSKRQNEKAAIDLGQKAPMEMIAKRVDNYENKIRPAAQAAANDILSIHQVRQVLDAGAFTGTGAQAKTFLAKIGEQLGIPSDQAQNTQVLGSVLARRVLAASGGTLGTGFSNADRDFMEQVAGGKATIDEGALRRILDIGERQGRQTLKNHDAEAERIQKLPGIGQLGADQFAVPAPAPYQEWAKANPLAPLQREPETGAAPAAPAPMPPSSPASQQGGGVSEGATATNPQTGQKIIFRGGRWMPAQ